MSSTEISNFSVTSLAKLTGTIHEDMNSPVLHCGASWNLFLLTESDEHQNHRHSNLMPQKQGFEDLQVGNSIVWGQVVP